jgi:hypothetical protein
MPKKRKQPKAKKAAPKQKKTKNPAPKKDPFRYKIGDSAA